MTARSAERQPLFFGDSCELISLADRLREIPQLLNIVVYGSLAFPDTHEDATAGPRRELERLLMWFELHLRDAAQRLDRKESARRRAEDRAERQITRHLEGLQTVNLADPFDPRGFFVYCLWGKDDDRPLYVGQSTNVLARLGSHLGDAKKRYKIERGRTGASLDPTRTRPLPAMATCGNEGSTTE